VSGKLSTKVSRVAKPSAVKRVEATRIEGSVRKLKMDRGFGFIAGDDGRDHFFHWSGMEKNSRDFRELEIQDRVSFVVIEGEKGPRAVCIRVLEDTELDSQLASESYESDTEEPNGNQQLSNIS